MNKEKFLEAYITNVNEHTELKKGAGGKSLTYLSWAWAWAEFYKLFPDATYEVKHCDGKLYQLDPTIGAFVETSITCGGTTHSMWLPVLDGANNPMKGEPYEFSTKEGKVVKVGAIDSFAINTAIMRCLTKNMAMFGLGLYIYAGEDLPEEQFEPMTDEQKTRLEELGVGDWSRVLAYLKVKDIKEISAQKATMLIAAKEADIEKRKTDVA